MTDLNEILKKMNLSESKIEEVHKKPQLQNNLLSIYAKYEPDNALLYTLACIVPKKVDIMFVADLVYEKHIKNEGELKGVFKFLEKNKEATKEEVIKFIKDNTKTKTEIIKIIDSLVEEKKSKKDILFELKKLLPLADFKEIMEELATRNIKEVPETVSVKERDWLDEGEIAKLHKPGENPQINSNIIKEHLERTKGRVVTRFPPEPNGILHIGHAKAINLDFGYAEKYGGYTYLRYDDTNPRNEEDYYFESILEDVKWLGFTPYKVTASSDYFEKMIEFAVKLINKAKAYICELSVEEIKSRRRELSKALEGKDCKTNDYAHILSPHRNRSKEENLKIFNEMVLKKHKAGTYTLRFKMDLESRNPLMFDLVGMRLVDEDHVKSGSKYNLYPSYEFALCVSDSLEDVTHSFCTQEFYTRQESYNWLLDQLEIYKPVQWEFSRLNMSNTILSKRKLVPLEKFGIKLDDPRLYTLKGLRRRGVPPNAINNFVRSLGITYSETVIDKRLLDSFIREELNRTARRIMCVINPIEVVVRNATKRVIKAPDLAVHDSKTREIVFKERIFIEKDDFSLSNSADFLRFTPTQPVGLYLAGAIKFVEMIDGKIIAELTDETPKKYIHWVPADAKKVEVRIYDDLFKSYNPDAVDYLTDINPDSLIKTYGYCDQRIEGCKPEDKFQFQRLGYFCVDFDSTPDNIILNKTISLK